MVMRQECSLISATNINEHFPISKVESRVNFMLRTRQKRFSYSMRSAVTNVVFTGFDGITGSVEPTSKSFLKVIYPDIKRKITPFFLHTSLLSQTH